MNLEKIYQQVKEIIIAEIQEEATDFSIGKFTGEAWCFEQDIRGGNRPDYPSIMLKQQKNGVHLYIAFWKFSKDEMEEMSRIFGKSAVGKSCIRLRKLTPERVEAIRNIAIRVME